MARICPDAFDRDGHAATLDAASPPSAIVSVAPAGAQLRRGTGTPACADFRSQPRVAVLPPQFRITTLNSQFTFHPSLFTFHNSLRPCEYSLQNAIVEVQTMANLEHLKILKQGASAWNKWREESPGINPDLRNASLIDADLRSSDLSGADLFEADLSMAILDERTSLGCQPPPRAPHWRLLRVERSRPLPEVVRTALSRP